MSIDRTIQEALKKAELPTEICSRRSLSGGCIHTVEQVELNDGTRVIAKINASRHVRLFEEEAAGLRALAETNTVLVPEPLATTTHNGTCVLLMTAIEPGPGSEHAWAEFGEQLAALHAAPVGTRFGFEMDNHLGTTPQPNEWCDDWVEFNARNRLGHQLTLATQHGLLQPQEIKAVERVIDRLDRFIPRKPKPSLLHGDLWSGNALSAVKQNEQGRAEEHIAVIDPACSIGDGWADIAMMNLFGGFLPACYECYEANVDDHDNVKTRLAVYQLYHVLNHINLFGRGYVGQAMVLTSQLR